MVPKKQLQLVGVTAFYLASKVEEVYTPLIGEIAYITANTYTTEEIRKMEKSILSLLNYNVNKPHMLGFLRYYTTVSDATATEHAMAKYIIECSLLQVELSSVYPSLRAAAALQLAKQLCSMAATPTWPAVLVHHSTYKEAQLFSTLRKLKEALCYVHRHPQFTTTRLKYGQSRFHSVSKMQVLAGLSQ